MLLGVISLYLMQNIIVRSFGRTGRLGICLRHFRLEQLRHLYRPLRAPQLLGYPAKPGGDRAGNPRHRHRPEQTSGGIHSSVYDLLPVRLPPALFIQPHATRAGRENAGLS